MRIFHEFCNPRKGRDTVNSRNSSAQEKLTKQKYICGSGRTCTLGYSVHQSQYPSVTLELLESLVYVATRSDLKD